MSEYIVNAANGLNGRVSPEPDAEVGAVRADGERIAGELEGTEWVAGEDGLFYRAEFLTVLMTEQPDTDDDDDPEADHGREDTQ